MNALNGEIHRFAANEVVPEDYLPLSEAEAQELEKLPPGERLFAYHALGPAYSKRVKKALQALGYVKPYGDRVGMEV